MMKNSPFLFLLLLIPFVAQAQSNMTLYHLPLTPQSRAMNPALDPEAKAYVGIPALSGIYASYGNNHFAYADLIRETDDDSLEMDFTNLLGRIKDRNTVFVNSNIELLNVGFKTGIGFFDISASEKIRAHIMLPGDIMRTAWEGIPEGNNTYDFGLAVNMNHYREYALGYRFDIKDKLKVGVRAKYLYGMENVWTERSDLTLESEEERYHLTGSADLMVRTSGLREDGMLMSGDFGVADYLFKKDNRGYALDLGATYEMDKWQFSMSVLDLGKINWKSETQNYYSASPNASYTYEGVLIRQLLLDSFSLEKGIEAVIDSAFNTFAVDTSSEAYSAPLPAQMYAGATYELTEKSKVGLLLHSQMYNSHVSAGITASFSTQLKKWLAFTGSYSFSNNAFNNLGLGVSLKLWRLHWYFASDNLLALANPGRVRYFQLQTGLNIVIPE